MQQGSYEKFKKRGSQISNENILTIAIETGSDNGASHIFRWFYLYPSYYLAPHCDHYRRFINF